MYSTDTLRQTFIISLVTFLLLHAFLPKHMHYLAFIFIILEATILWVIASIETGFGEIRTTARLLATYVALSALIIDESKKHDESQD